MSDQDASRMTPIRGLPGTSILVRRTQGPGLAGGTHYLEAPLGSPGGARKHCWQEEAWKNPGAANRNKIE